MERRALWVASGKGAAVALVGLLALVGGHLLAHSTSDHGTSRAMMDKSYEQSATTEFDHLLVDTAAELSACSFALLVVIGVGPRRSPLPHRRVPVLRRVAQIASCPEPPIPKLRLAA